MMLKIEYVLALMNINLHMVGERKFLLQGCFSAITDQNAGRGGLRVGSCGSAGRVFLILALPSSHAGQETLNLDPTRRIVRSHLSLKPSP